MATSSTSTSTSTQNQDNRIVIPLATDERCWFKCRQSNAGRLRGQEPICSIFCYYSNQLPLLIKDPVTVLKSTSLTTTKEDENSQKNSSSNAGLEINDKEEMITESRWDELVNKYTFKSLRGKYFYFATGKPAINRHLSSMSQIGSVEHEWLIQKFKRDQLLLQQQHEQDPPEKSNTHTTTPKQISDKSYRGLMVLAYHKDYENVINIAHSIATGLASIHGHIEKIYGPGYKIMSRIPKSLSELRDPDCDKIPSQFTLIHDFFNRPLLSYSTNLLTRSFESVSEVLSRLATKYASSLNNKDKGVKPSDPPFGPGGSSNKPTS